jgi:asparagine synthetase B (glutamine-hydrolysing)
MTDFLITAELRSGAIRVVTSGQLASRHTFGAGRFEGCFAGDLLGRSGLAPAAAQALEALGASDATRLTDLHGGYALAVWDGATRALTLLCDAVGRWTLHHAVSARSPTTLIVGTSARAVAREAGLLDRITSEAADEFWVEGFVRPARAVFAGVQPLRLGERVRFHLDADAPRATCDLVRPAPGPRCVDDDPTVVRQTLGALLESAMDRVTHDAPTTRPVVTLSGGIDSTLVAALASRRVRNLSALTLGALVPGTQDELWARYAAARLGVRLSVIRPHLGPLGPLIARSAGAPEQPLWVKTLAMYRALAESHGQARVLLTGDCADGVFLGGTEAWKWTGDMSATAAPVDFGPPLPEWLGTTGRDQATNHAVGHLLARQLHVTRDLGVLARSPFIDWDLMSYARSLPRHILLQPGRTKAVLQEQLAGWPQLFLNRPKLGFPFRLRWAMAARGELGALPALVSPRSVERFRGRLPRGLQRQPDRWGTTDIFRHFDDVLRLVSWTAFDREASG